jgi:alpha-beta hydrolase superfamily lysophospholipase
VRADQVYGLVNLMDEARKSPQHLRTTTPILFLYGARDQVIPRPPTVAVIRELDGRTEVRRYPNGYHMLLRDLDGETIWADIANWIAPARGPTSVSAHTASTGGNGR